MSASLGALLYLLYVNDIPNPLYYNTIVSRFADDVVCLVSASVKGGGKHKRAPGVIARVQNEVRRIDKWEASWKIKTNFNKSVIGVRGIRPQTISNAGGIIVNNIPINVNNSVKILGCLFSCSSSFKPQCSCNAARARAQLSKLLRFKNAPINVKLYLYKVLIRPILEYPPVLLADASKTSIKLLQSVQSKALRFVYDVKWDDFVSNVTLHNRAGIDLMQDRLKSLQDRVHVKFKDIYFNDDPPPFVYRFSDFSLDNVPSCSRNKTVHGSFTLFNHDGFVSGLH